MRPFIPYAAALSLALVAGAPGANAQLLVTQSYGQPYQTVVIQPSGTLLVPMQPMQLVAVPAGVIQPVQTVQTIETVRTVRPAARHQIVATRTIVHRVALAGNSRPLYDYAGSTPPAPAPSYQNATYYNGDATYTRPLYATAAMPVMQTVATPVMQTVATPVVATAVIAAPAYRYVYQWDRILVVDPSTNLVVQTLWR